MSFLDRRRAKLSPAQQRAIEAETRRQIAVAINLAKRKAEQELAQSIEQAKAENAMLSKRIREMEQREARGFIGDLDV